MSTAAVSWYAILNMEKVELEIIWDSDMYFSLGKCMRSGVSYISKRYSKTNKKYWKCYDPI